LTDLQSLTKRTGFAFLDELTLFDGYPYFMVHTQLAHLCPYRPTGWSDVNDGFGPLSIITCRIPPTI